MRILILSVLIIVLSGCDKVSGILTAAKNVSALASLSTESDRKGRTSLDWSHTVDVDKLDNVNIQKAERIFINKGSELRVYIGFECTDSKKLEVRITSFQNIIEKKHYLPAELDLNLTMETDQEFIRTRNGENKLAFLVKERKFNNEAVISLKSNQTGQSGLAAEITALTEALKGATATLDIANQGYTLPLNDSQLENGFRSPLWVIEIPTKNGTVVHEVDLSHSVPRKVFDACAWKPLFSRAITGPQSSEQSTKNVQSNSNARLQEPPNAESQTSKHLVAPKEIQEVIVVEKVQRERDYSLTLTADRIEYNQKGMNFIVSAEEPSVQKLIINNIGARIRVTYVSGGDCSFCISRAVLLDPHRANTAPAQELTPSSNPVSPSFDCSKASNVAESLICNDRDLSKLDVELARAYTRARESGGGESLRTEQIAWLKTTRNACSDKDCLSSVLRKRISDLSR
jgi:uncharacterized protein YecT (DUF1311 family)